MEHKGVIIHWQRNDQLCVDTLAVSNNRIVMCLVLSLTTGNFLMPLTRTPVTWCIAQIIGYLPVPLMNTSLDVVYRSTIPTQMQGRVYSCRNMLQFFTIPIGYFLGG